VQCLGDVTGVDTAPIAGKVPVVGQRVEHGAGTSNIEWGGRGVGAPGECGCKLR
jgi:hypothetical protein